MRFLRTGGKLIAKRGKLIGVAAALFGLTVLAGWTTDVDVARADDTASVVIEADLPNHNAPKSLTVSTGTTVTWTAESRLPHTVTSDGCGTPSAGPCTFDSGTERLLMAGSARSTFAYKFERAGVYQYYCRIHGAPGGIGHAGTVTVVAPDGLIPENKNPSAAMLRPNLSVVVHQPAEGATIVGDKVDLLLGINGANVRRAPGFPAPVDPLNGHFAVILDRNVDQTIQIGAGPGVTQVTATTASLEGVAPGAHTLTAVWVYDNNVPPQPPIAWTVRFNTVAGASPAGPVPSGPTFPAAAGGPGAIAPPSTGSGGLADDTAWTGPLLLLAGALAAFPVSRLALAVSRRGSRSR